RVLFRSRAGGGRTPGAEILLDRCLMRPVEMGRLVFGQRRILRLYVTHSLVWRTWRGWGKRREPWHRARRRAGLGPFPRCPNHAPPLEGWPLTTAAKPSLTIHPFGVDTPHVSVLRAGPQTTSMGSRPTDVTGVSCSILSTAHTLV